MSVTDCCAENETQCCVSRATARAAHSHGVSGRWLHCLLTVAASLDAGCTACSQSLCLWTLAARPAHSRHVSGRWLHGLLTVTMSLDAGCTGWSLQDHGAAWEQGLTAAPITENGSHCAPSFQERANFKVWFLSNVDHFCTTIKSENPKLNHCKVGTICTMMDDN